jgi:hypothetical protein
VSARRPLVAALYAVVAVAISVPGLLGLPRVFGEDYFASPAFYAFVSVLLALAIVAIGSDVRDRRRRKLEHVNHDHEAPRHKRDD